MRNYLLWETESTLQLSNYTSYLNNFEDDALTAKAEYSFFSHRQSLRHQSEKINRVVFIHLSLKLKIFLSISFSDK